MNRLHPEGFELLRVNALEIPIMQVFLRHLPNHHHKLILSESGLDPLSYVVLNIRHEQRSGC